MAGPALIVVTPNRICDASQKTAEAIVSALSEDMNVSGKFWNFRIAGRPFTMWHGCDSTGEELEPDMPPSNAFGFTPAGQIGLSAMCNQTVDHILLATLACRLVKIFQGIVWLDGKWKGEHEPFPQDGLISIGSHSHFVTGQFIERWIDRPNFRLPK